MKATRCFFLGIFCTCLLGVCLHMLCVSFVASEQGMESAVASSQKDDSANKPLWAVYVMPTLYGANAPRDFSNSDLRGLYLHIDLNDGPIGPISFENSDLTGFTTSDETQFAESSFKSAVLCDTYLGMLHKCDFTDAVVRRGTGVPTDSANYKKKDLSGLRIDMYANYGSFNLSRSCIVTKSSEVRKANIYSNYTDADITDSVVMGIDREYGVRQDGHPRYLFPYLHQTKNYKERNMGGIVFVNMDLENADLSWQTLGYFDSCDLSRVNFEEAYFHAHDEMALAPFSRIIPVGFTGCKISMEQFRTTRNYKIWKESGIPSIQKIRITPENARYYNFEIVEGKVRHKDYSKTWAELIPIDDVFVYKVGNIHVTEEIANALLKEQIKL